MVIASRVSLLGQTARPVFGKNRARSQIILVIQLDMHLAWLLRRCGLSQARLNWVIQVHFVVRQQSMNFFTSILQFKERHHE